MAGRRQRLWAVTSTITMLEGLVHPYRQADHELVNQFYALLSTYQAATALASGATGYITNDAAFQRVTDLDVLLLDEL